MVVIHIKKTETDQFLFETTTKESVDSLVRELVAVWNGRHRILRLADACKDLAKHGPLKPADQRGLDEVSCSRREGPSTRRHTAPHTGLLSCYIHTSYSARKCVCDLYNCASSSSSSQCTFFAAAVFFMFVLLVSG